MCYVLFSCSVVSGSLRPHGLQHARLPGPSSSPWVSSNSYPLCRPCLWVCSNSCPLSWWCHPAISSSVTPFFFCPQSFPEPWSFPVSQLFASGGQSTEPSASASVFSMSIQGWFPSGLTGSVSSLPKGLWRVFSSTTVQKHPCGICDIKKRPLSALRVTWGEREVPWGLFHESFVDILTKILSMAKA